MFNQTLFSMSRIAANRRRSAGIADRVSGELISTFIHIAHRGIRPISILKRKRGRDKRKVMNMVLLAFYTEKNLQRIHCGTHISQVSRMVGVMGRGALRAGFNFLYC